VTPLPPLAELLPHARPMRLLERALAHDGEHTVCLALPAASTLFQEAGGMMRLREIPAPGGGRA
jgi:predicted hotdog family 3-hydroxylacyl-ACP dehydratase